ncbi:hypothetical protein L0F63_003587 [Massospora cicadina]|nr:hypothetical protein L0F63_003587 [Massospora cicadina]
MNPTNISIRPKRKTKIYLSDQVIHKVGSWLTPDQRLKFMELDQQWYNGLIKFFFETLDDYWLRKDSNELKRMLKKYGSEVRKVNLIHRPCAKKLEHIFEFCPNITRLNVEEFPINELFDLAHRRYAKQLVEIQLGAPYDEKFPELSQIPHFPNIHTLRCQRMLINSNLLSELLYFVPENIRVLNLSKLSAIEGSTIRYITTSFPNLEFLDLIGEFFLESAILSLDFQSTKLSMLTVGEVGSLTRACHKFQLKPSNLPNLTELRVRGWEGLAEEGNRMPQLLAGTQYPYRHLILYALNMNVDYMFTSQRFPKLAYLSLDSCTLLSVDTITQIFTCLPILVKLSLENAAISDEHFAVLCRRRKVGQLMCSPIRYLSVKDLNTLGVYFLSFMVTQMGSLQYLDVTDTLPNGTIPSTFMEALDEPGITLNLMTLRARAPYEEFQTTELFDLRDNVRPKLEIRTDIEDYDVFFSQG